MKKTTNDELIVLPHRGVCGKLIYATKSIAKKRSKIIEKRCGHMKNSYNRAKLRVYYCDKCSGWHTTRMPLDTFNTFF